MIKSRGIVVLSPSEMLVAAQAGIMRSIDQIAKKALEYHLTGEDDGFSKDVLGALCECALAKSLNLYWAGKGKFRAADVGAHIQVRGTARAGSISLILHPEDPPEAAFHLVRYIPRSFKFEVFEPIMAINGKQEKYWRTDVRSPCYMVPAENVNRN